MICKDVIIERLSSGIQEGIREAEKVFHDAGLPFRITCLTRHGGASWHNPAYHDTGECNAADFGIKNEYGNYDLVKAEWIAQELKNRLPDYFDIVFGDEGHRDHIHLEYDVIKAG